MNLLIKNLSGLTLRDARRLAANAIEHDGAITDADLPRVMQAKFDLLNRGGVLQFELETAALDDIAGLARLKKWLQLRRRLFAEGTSSHGLPPPKGVLLLGVQGCGKSLAAKACAGGLGVPLLRFDFAAIYDKYHGETERKLRESLAVAEVMAPCVLWIDEIEKAVATSGSDGGVSRRVLGYLLTWMAERKAPVFLVATANDVSHLPPELLRKGRFDEIFFVDLPDEQARQAIFALQFERRELDQNNFDLPALASASNGFSGAEIEQAVVSALYQAHAAHHGKLNQQTIISELAGTRPLSVLMADRIDDLRRWAASRTVPAD